MEIAWAPAGGARVLLLDELSSGMGAGELAEFAGTLHVLRADGLAPLMVGPTSTWWTRPGTRVYALREDRAVAPGGACGRLIRAV